MSLGVAVLAQKQLDRRQDVNMTLVLYGLAAVLFALIFRPAGLERSQRARPVARPPATGFLAVGLALGFLSFFGFSRNRLSPLGLILWLGGLGLCLWALRSGVEEGWMARLRISLGFMRWRSFAPGPLDLHRPSPRPRQ